MENCLKQVADFALFARIVQNGGISSCARALAMERTTVSRRLANLEKRLGVTLIERSPRGAQLTEAGKRCFGESARIWLMANQASSLATQANQCATPSLARPIKLGAPSSLIEYFLEPLFASNPALPHVHNVRLVDTTTMPPDRIPPYDVELSFSKSEVLESLPVVTLPQGLFVCPKTFDGVDDLRSPEDLARYPLALESAQKSVTFTSTMLENEYPSTVTLEPRFVVSDIHDVLSIAEAGLAIGLMPRYLSNSANEENRLLRVLPDLDVKDRTLFLVKHVFDATGLFEELHLLLSAEMAGWEKQASLARNQIVDSQRNLT